LCSRDLVTTVEWMIPHRPAKDASTRSVISSQTQRIRNASYGIKLLVSPCRLARLRKQSETSSICATESDLIGGVAQSQWLGRRSLAGGLSLIYALSMVDMWPLRGWGVRKGSTNQANSASHPSKVGKWVITWITGVETIKRQTGCVQLVVHRLACGRRLSLQPVCDMNSASAVAVCGLRRYTIMLYAFAFDWRFQKC